MKLKIVTTRPSRQTREAQSSFLVTLVCLCVSLCLGLGVLIVPAGTWENWAGVQGRAVEMMKGLPALIYGDMVGESNMNNSPHDAQGKT